MIGRRKYDVLKKLAETLTDNERKQIKEYEEKNKPKRKRIISKKFIQK